MFNSRACLCLARSRCVVSRERNAAVVRPIPGKSDAEIRG